MKKQVPTQCVLSRYLRLPAPALLVAFAIACSPTLSFAQTKETILDARIWLDGKTVQDLEMAGLETDHGFYEPGQFFRAELAASELRLLKLAGFRIDTLEADVIGRYLRENAIRKPVRTSPASDRGPSPCDGYGANTGTPINYTYGSMGGFYTYEEFLAILDDMHAKFPHLISARAPVSATLLTQEGRPQWYVRISDHPDTEEADEPEALYTGLHHAREPNSLSHLIYYMWYLLENYDRDPELKYLIDHTELYFIPCLNPDGYIFNQTTDPNGGGFWRKNRRDNGDGSFGVDLNRNYSYNWGDGFGGSSSDPFSDVYHGPAPFSEPETQMAKQFIEKHDFEIVLNCHTSGNRLVHPWGYENSVPTPDFTTLAAWLTRESNYLHGSCWQTLGYLSNGTSDDWMYAEKFKFAFTPETGSSFWPFIDQIDGNNKGMLLTNLSAAWYALGGAVIRHQPGETIIGNTLNMPFKVKQYELGTGPILVSFEALSANIDGFSSIQPISIQDFGNSSFSVVVNLNSNIQAGESIRFVALSERFGQIRTDTIETLLNPAPYAVVFEDNQEIPTTQWATDAWGPTTEQAYASSKSMTDSPFDIYTLEENNLTSADPILVPANASEARLRFFTRWEIESGLDWAQVLISLDGGAFFSPLNGSLSNVNPALNEPVYDGDHPNWEEECIDLNPYRGLPIFLRFSMTSFSGNAGGKDGFYFDDLILEYRTENGVFTHEIPDSWHVQSRPNPAGAQTMLVWENKPTSASPIALEVWNAGGSPFQRIPILDPNSNHYRLETALWPAGVYFYRLNNGIGNSEWRRLTVVH